MRRAWHSAMVGGWLLMVLGLVTSLAGRAEDWPQWLGPRRDGTSGEALADRWPADGPKVAWSRAVGAGFSGPAVMGGRLVLHHRQRDEEVVECLDAANDGRTLWRQSYPTAYRDDFGFDNGPRGTPAIADGHVVTFGAEGMLACWRLDDGRKVWQVAAGRDLRAGKGFFGFACSPLVLDGRVIVQVGGPSGAGVVAWDLATGAKAWSVTDDEAGYASPVAGTLAGESCAFCFTREGLVVVEPRTGRVALEFGWRSPQHASVNAATPLVLGDRVFLTSSYGTGAVLLSLRERRALKVWSGDESLSSHYASVVHREGFIYGFHGRQESGASLRCIELRSGKVQWSEDGFGSGAVLVAQDRLVILTEGGELLVAAADPKSFRVSQRAQVLGKGIRAQPALSGGRFYARDPRKLVALEVGTAR